MDQAQSHDGSVRMTRGQAKRQILEKRSNDQNKRLKRCFKNGEQGTCWGNPVNQRMGKIKIENELTMKVERTEDIQPFVLPDNSLNDDVVYLNVKTEDENSFPEETEEEKVVFVSSEIDCSQDVVLSSKDQDNYRQETFTSDCFPVKLEKPSSICGDFDEHPLNAFQLNERVFVKQDINVENASDEETFAFNPIQQHNQVENISNVADLEDPSSDVAQSHCQCPCWIEIQKLKAVIQQMGQNNLNLIKPTAPVKDCGTQVELHQTQQHVAVECNDPQKCSTQRPEPKCVSFAMKPEIRSDEVSIKKEDEKTKAQLFIYISSDLLKADWLETVMKYSSIDRLIRNPFPSGVLHVVDDGSLQNDPRFADALNALTTLIEIIGKQVHCFNFQLQMKFHSSSVYWYKSFHHWIQCMPNLTKLCIDWGDNISEACLEQVNKLVHLLPFPKLLKLTSISISGVSQPVVRSVLKSNANNITKLTTTDLRVDQHIILPSLEFMSVTLREVDISFKYFNNITAPLQKLHCKFQGRDQINLNGIILATSRFSNTLTSLSLSFEHSACDYLGLLKFRLPHLTSLNIEFCSKSGCNPSNCHGDNLKLLTCILSELKSLKELTINRVCVDHWPDDKCEAQNSDRSLISISVKSASDVELQDKLGSQMWRLLPCLEKLNISLLPKTNFWDVNDGISCTKSFVYSRPT